MVFPTIQEQDRENSELSSGIASLVDYGALSNYLYSVTQQTVAFSQESETTDNINLSLMQYKNTVKEGEYGVYSLVLDKALEEDTKVNIVIDNISTQDSDVEPLSKEVTIPAGKSSVDFLLNIVDDALIETKEDFKVRIADVENKNINFDSAGIITTIVDNEE